MTPDILKLVPETLRTLLQRRASDLESLSALRTALAEVPGDRSGVVGTKPLHKSRDASR
jgi:hypothetical protein